VRSFVLALALTACSSSLPHPTYERQPQSALVEVAFPPPPARPEIIPDPPRDDAVWIDGEWAWRGRRWAWRSGRWVVPPAGCAFSPWTMVRRDDGVLFFAPGTWRDAKGDAVDAPKPLALGGATSGAVVDPSGDVEITGQGRTKERTAPP
jgi:hypothetical protein